MNTATPIPVGDWLDPARGDRVALETPHGERVGYARLAARADRLATRLLAAGVRHGDRVATLCLNHPDQVVLLFACARAGMVLVPLSWRATPVETAVLLADARPALLLHDAGRAEQARAACERVENPPRTARLGEHGVEAGVPTVGDAAAAGHVSVDDDLLLLYTSGSSGRPKGVPLTHANCWWTNASLAVRMPLSQDDVVLLVLPQFHVAAWNVQPLLALHVGARVLVTETFDPGRVLEVVETSRATCMMGVPATYQALAAHPRFEAADLSSLRLVVVGGAAVDPALLSTWARRGHSLTVGYGLTEAGPNTLCSRPEDAGSNPALAPYRDVEVTVRDGELWVRGPAVFAGYWRDPAPARGPDGWFATGDLVERDASGGLRVCGRVGDMFVSGGENVAPAEVESALLQDPDVTAAAVVGVPDPRWGQAGVAFVVLREPGDLSAAERIRTRARDRLAGFKVPREIVVLPELPSTGSGKIDKPALRARGEAR